MDKIKIRELLNKKYERDDFKNLTQSIFKNCNYFNSPKTINPNNDKILIIYIFTYYHKLV